jgi:hypothetical protein
MKRKKIKSLVNICMLLIAIILVKQWTASSNIDNQSTLIIDDPFTNVKKYRPLLQEELKKYELEEYTDVLMALMQQESRGKGGDPMQSSEAAGLAPNEITDPKESIIQGVQHFHRVFTYGKEKKVDFLTVIQSYNMGMGYITYIADHGGTHTEKLAKKFSMLQVKKNPNTYNCGGDKNNFRYPYCYGDFTYSTKVEKNIELISDDSIPAMSNSEATGEPF